MLPKVDALQASLKAAAVGGIFMVCARITIEAFKLSWHIISTPREVETWEPVRKVVCEECKGFFEDELDEDGNYICFSCGGVAPPRRIRHMD